MQPSSDRQLHAPFASILIPTYRRPDLLRLALERCLEQSANLAEPIEIVVIDNCPGRSAEDAVKERIGDGSPRVRYVHEPRPGVVFARNSALRAARGRFVIFLDDDQAPQEGWLSAFVKVAKGGAKAAFGPLDPAYDVPPAKHKGILDKMFSRQIPASDGDEITRFYPYLGTGNSIFDKTECFPSDPAFDARFNKIGGEDVWMLKGLCSRNIPLIWVAGAYVLERVPVGRTTPRYLAKRKYSSGQIRSLLTLHPAGRRPLALFFWMGAGAIQAAFYGSRFLFASLFQPHKAEDFLIRSAGGAGKIFWFGALTGK
jgi:succinoglycan biosynthesis protein ExoM